MINLNEPGINIVFSFGLKEGFPLGLVFIEVSQKAPFNCKLNIIFEYYA